MKAFSVPLLAGLGLTASAQSFVAPSQDTKTVSSENWTGAEIEYKKVNGVCETTEGVDSYSGYVRLPSKLVPDASATGLGENDTANYHFWYFEARNEPKKAPTAVFFGGGPGYGSYDGSAVFPCYFNEDGNSTTLNEHSWNNDVNMLYIDNPIGTGFSYVTLANGTLSTMNNTFLPAIADEETMQSVTDVDDLPEVNMTMIPATLPVVTQQNTVNSSMAAAKMFWKFAQVWFNEFPEIHTENEDISIWGVSYAGYYINTFTRYFLEQNELIRNGEHEMKQATELKVPTVGILNAMTDIEAMAYGYLDFARNNTYDQPLIDEDTYTKLKNQLENSDGGCLSLASECKKAQAKAFESKESTLACGLATKECAQVLLFTLEEASTWNPFDISIHEPASNPVEYEAAFFNQPWVQAELGLPLNYTRGNDLIPDIMFANGDLVRYDLSQLGDILDAGVNLAMVFGDRDLRCNWISAENASLHIPFDDAKSFSEAGYADIVTNSSYNGGLVREYGGLSFSRVFQAGHATGGFQPETVSKIFERAIFRKDVATGEIDLTENTDYQSEGESEIRDVKNKAPEPIENICYSLTPALTCTEEQRAALLDGSAEIENFIVVSPKGTTGEDGDDKDKDDGEDADDGDNSGDSNDSDNGNGNGNGNGGGDSGDDEDDEEGGNREAGAAAMGVSSLLAAVPLVGMVILV